MTLFPESCIWVQLWLVTQLSYDTLVMLLLRLWGEQSMTGSFLLCVCVFFFLIYGCTCIAWPPCLASFSCWKIKLLPVKLFPNGIGIFCIHNSISFDKILKTSIVFYRCCSSAADSFHYISPHKSMVSFQLIFLQTSVSLCKYMILCLSSWVTFNKSLISHVVYKEIYLNNTAVGSYFALLIAGSRSGLPCLSFVYQQNLRGYLSPPCCSLPSPDCTPEPLVCPCILIISHIVWWQCNFCNFIEIYTYMCTCRSTLNICLALPNI